MTQSVSRPRILPSVLFWSVISAAFIGPGTVATASKAGSDFGVSLIWAICFSVIATIVLQEAAARLTITTGKNLGEHLRELFRTHTWIPVAIWLCVAFGCAAFEAGNILGAVSGLQLLLPWDPRLLGVLITCIAGLLLFQHDIRLIAKILGVLVAIMGICFMIVATHTSISAGALLKGAFVPRLSLANAWIVIGLVGTTVVPYNLFLGSRIAHGQTVSQMRRGMIPAVIIGGIISVSILLAGTLVKGGLEFSSLSAALETELGKWAGLVFSAGLCAAGLTSAVTAPLAAAITAQSIFPAWHNTSRRYRAVWLCVLGVGFVMSMMQWRPLPVILAAQMINGMLLPVVAVVLFALAFRSQPGRSTIRLWHVGLAWVIIMVILFLGLHSILSAGERAEFWIIGDQARYQFAGLLSLMTGVIAWWWRVHLRRSAISD